MFSNLLKSKADRESERREVAEFEAAHKHPKLFVDQFIVMKGRSSIRVAALESDVDKEFTSEVRLGFVTTHGSAKALAELILDQLGYKVTLASKVPLSK